MLIQLGCENSGNFATVVGGFVEVINALVTESNGLGDDF